jgi:protein O-mannosyl-transferase
MKETPENDSFLGNGALWSIFAVVAFVTYKAYAKTFDFGFIFDDHPTIVNNFFLKVQSSKDIFLAHSRWVSTMWNSFTYSQFGFVPSVFRKHNIFLHLINSALIFLVLKSLFQKVDDDSFIKKRAGVLAIISSMLFLLHPAQTQTATYITQTRLEGLALFFILSVVGLFLLADNEEEPWKKGSLFMASAIVAGASAGTKEIVIVIPALLIMIDLLFLEKTNSQATYFRVAAHLAVAMAICAAFYSFSFSSTVPFSFSSIVKLDAALDNNRGNLLTSGYGEKITAYRYFISQFKVMTHYIKIYFLPTGLSFDYDFRLAKDFWKFDVLAPLIFLVSTLVFAFTLWWKKRAKPLVFGIFWFFITVLPRASIVPSAEMVCDYKTHIGSIGMMVIFAYLFILGASKLTDIFANSGSKFSEKKIQSALVGLLMFASYSATVARNDVWSTNLKFWGDVIKKAPRKARAYNNYAVALAESGRADESLKFYEISCACDANYAEPIINLGSHYNGKGDSQKAKAYYEKACLLRHEPHPECYSSLGIIYFNEKNYKEARKNLETAIYLKGHFGKPRYYLAKIYEEEGNYQAAFNESQWAIYGDFAIPQAYLLNGKCAIKLGDLAAGTVALEKALQSGYDREGLFLLASAHYQSCAFDQAAERFGQIYRHEPGNLVVSYNYAQALMKSAKFEQALPLFEQCKASSSSYVFVDLHIAKCLNGIGSKREALGRIDECLKGISPDNVKADALALREEIISNVLCS